MHTEKKKAPGSEKESLVRHALTQQAGAKGNAASSDHEISSLLLTFVSVSK